MIEAIELGSGNFPTDLMRESGEVDDIIAIPQQRLKICFFEIRDLNPLDPRTSRDVSAPIRRPDRMPSTHERRAQCPPDKAASSCDKNPHVQTRKPLSTLAAFYSPKQPDIHFRGNSRTPDKSSSPRIFPRRPPWSVSPCVIVSQNRFQASGEHQ